MFRKIPPASLVSQEFHVRIVGEIFYGQYDAKPKGFIPGGIRACTKYDGCPRGLDATPLRAARPTRISGRKAFDNYDGVLCFEDPFPA